MPGSYLYPWSLCDKILSWWLLYPSSQSAIWEGSQRECSHCRVWPNLPPHLWGGIQSALGISSLSGVLRRENILTEMGETSQVTFGFREFVFGLQRSGRTLAPSVSDLTLPCFRALVLGSLGSVWHTKGAFTIAAWNDDWQKGVQPSRLFFLLQIYFFTLCVLCRKFSFSFLCVLCTTFQKYQKYLRALRCSCTF